MGDRVVVVFKSRDNPNGVAMLYAHWLGGDVVDVLVEAAPGMRRGDAPYAAARAIAAVCARCKGPLGVGVMAPPETLEHPADLSHGDAGVLVVDCDTGEMTAHGGYLAGCTLPVLALAKV